MSGRLEYLGELIIRLSFLASSGIFLFIAWLCMQRNQGMSNYAPDTALAPAMFIVGAIMLAFVACAPYVVES